DSRPEAKLAAAAERRCCRGSAASGPHARSSIAPAQGAQLRSAGSAARAPAPRRRRGATPSRPRAPSSIAPEEGARLARAQRPLEAFERRGVVVGAEFHDEDARREGRRRGGGGG